jgi:uncharacterized protein (DUF2252 family)
MAQSSHAYVRGNTAKFYEWLQSSRSSENLPDGPPVWICGDCHVGNLGPIAATDGSVDIQIRDLDQTVFSNPAYDLIRLGLSLATAARSSDLPGVTTALMIEELVAGYELALAQEDEEFVHEPDAVRVVRDRALNRKWRHLARERLDDVSPTIPLGPRFWPLSKDERIAMIELFETPAIRQFVSGLSRRDKETQVRLVDAAYWKKGCSSLGTLRFAVLTEVDGELSLVDIKEAVPTVATGVEGHPPPADHAKRVVTGARALSPNLGDRMAPAMVLGKPVVARELMPQDLKIEIEQFSRGQATRAARYLAYVVGFAHARQMDKATRKAWSRELASRTRSLDAPSWLWTSVLNMLAYHERGYLEHCRRYALSRTPATPIARPKVVPQRADMSELSNTPAKANKLNKKAAQKTERALKQPAEKHKEKEEKPKKSLKRKR